MSKDEWYSKLNIWAHEDSRLEKMPLVYLWILAEHIANAQANEQQVQTDEPCWWCEQAKTNRNLNIRRCPFHGMRIRGLMK